MQTQRPRSGGRATAPPQPRGHLDLRTYVPAFIAFISYKLARGASRLYQTHFGVTTIDWRIMALLAAEPGISGQHICRQIGLDRASVSRSLTSLQARGLVRSHASADARERLVALTQSGMELYERIAEIALERERRLLSCLSPDERATLAALLDRVHKNIGAVDEPLEIAGFDERDSALDAS